MLNHALCAEQALEENFRINAIYWLAVCNDGKRLPEALTEALTDCDLEPIDIFDRPVYEPGVGHWQIAETLKNARLNGFVAHVETPVPTLASGGEQVSHGWGRYTGFWIYAETLEALYAKARTTVLSYRHREMEALHGVRRQHAQVVQQAGFKPEVGDIPRKA